MSPKEVKLKSFWQRPEGITGAVFLSLILLGTGVLFVNALPQLVLLAENTLYLTLMLAVLASIAFVFINSKTRNFLWYVYKSAMRSITGLFVQLDPIGILKSYVDSLEENMTKMTRQVNQLRAQMHKLKEQIVVNERQINSNLQLASDAKSKNKQSVMILKSRKAGRLKESNMRLSGLYKKMEVIYRVLVKMKDNSEILKEDIKDQVMVKEQERKAIHASHSAMKSAVNIINGHNDKRQMFDQALEAIAEDVGAKVGEMERFMDMSANFMDSVDLQNGVFEEEGLKMLEDWEKNGISKILGEEKEDLLLMANSDEDVLDLDAPIAQPEKQKRGGNQYDSFFD